MELTGLRPLDGGSIVAACVESRRNLVSGRQLNADPLAGEKTVQTQHVELELTHLGMFTLGIIMLVGTAFSPLIGQFDDPWFWVCIASFAIGGLYLVQYRSAKLTFDSLGLVYKTRVGTWALRWDDLSDWYTYSNGEQIVFRGPERQLTILGPQWWPRKQREELLSQISSILASHHIGPTPKAKRAGTFRPQNRRCRRSLAA